MARITVEDCIEKVQNRFELILLAAERGKRISSGVQLTVDRNNDKDHLIALREIAVGNIDVKTLKESLIHKLQSSGKLDQIEEEVSWDVEEQLPTNLDYVSEEQDFYTDDPDSDDLNNDIEYDKE